MVLLPNSLLTFLHLFHYLSFQGRMKTIKSHISEMCASSISTYVGAVILEEEYVYKLYKLNLPENVRMPDEFVRL